MMYWNKDQLKELKETVANASKAAIKLQEQKNCKDLAIIPDKQQLFVMDHKENSMNVEPVENLWEDPMSMNSNEFDNEIPSVYTVLEGELSSSIQQLSDETAEEGLDISLLNV